MTEGFIPEVRGGSQREQMPETRSEGAQSSAQSRTQLRDAEELREKEQEAAKIYAEILARAPEHDVQPSLERVRGVCELLGDPQTSAQVVHITGTNGKTSTARMIDSLLQEAGLRTGRFTSPHLTSVRERIVIDGESISARQFVSVYQDVLPYIEMVDESSLAAGGPRLSFFEVLTVLAFAAFADAPVDIIVLEVGMGGRWDATNVADGAVAVLTPIAMDHERFLGNTMVEIAGEKVGIIKDGATVISAEQRDDVESVLDAEVAQRGARWSREGVELSVADRVLAVGGQVLTLNTTGGSYQEVFIPLHGEHQAHNALLALATVEAVLTDGQHPVSGQIVEAGFAAVTSPGRLEVARKSPTILVDAAHNPAGVDALVDAVAEAFSFSRLVGLVGVLKDKDAENLLGGLEPLLDEIVVTRSSSPRAMDPEELAQLAREIFGDERVQVSERLDDALDLAVQTAEGGAPGGSEFSAGVLAVGSVTIAAEVRILLGLQ